MTARLGVLCSGRGSNMMALQAAIEGGTLPAEIKIVITDTSEAGALTRAREAGLYATVVPRSAYHANRDGFERRLVELMKQVEVELVILAGFERLIGPVLLAAFPGRIINIHPALLPAFPGLGVWPAQVEYGVRLAGPTVHFVDAGLDSGPIIIQGAVPVLDQDTPDDLAARILAVEHRILAQAVKWFAEGRLSLEGRRVVLSPPPADPADLALIWPPLDPRD